MKDSGSSSNFWQKKNWKNSKNSATNWTHNNIVRNFYFSSEWRNSRPTFKDIRSNNTRSWSRTKCKRKSRGARLTSKKFKATKSWMTRRLDDFRTSEREQELMSLPKLTKLNIYAQQNKKIRSKKEKLSLTNKKLSNRSRLRVKT